MKKQILIIGETLNREELKNISGGISNGINGDPSGSWCNITIRIYTAGAMTQISETVNVGGESPLEIDMNASHGCYEILASINAGATCHYDCAYDGFGH